MTSTSREIFSLTPPQEMINFMLKYSFFHKQVTQIPASITLTRKIDFDIMQKAFKTEIERNDCLRLRIEKKGKNYRQYFLDSFDYGTVPVKNFSSPEELESFFTADAQKTIKVFKGEDFRVFFYNTSDGRNGIFFNVSHLIMDATAVFIFFNDLLAVYEALEAGTEMPKPLGSYRETIRRELEYINNAEKVKKDRDFYIDYFAKDKGPIWNGVMGNGPLLEARKKKKNPDLRACGSFDPIHDKAVLIKKPVSFEDSKVILDYMAETGVSGELISQLGMRLHVSKINGNTNDTHFLLLSNRRKTVNEKRSGGTMASAMPWRVILPPDLTFAEAIDKIKDVQSDIMRHVNYPFLRWRDDESNMYHYSMTDGTTTMMLSWFPLEKDTMNNWEYEFHSYNLGSYVMPLYSYAMKDPYKDTLRFAYLHRTDTISDADIDSLHDNTIKAMVMGCANPEIKLSEILAEID